MEMTKLESSLAWIESPVQYLKGVGPYFAKLYAKMEIRSFEDLLYHFPFRYIDQRQIDSIQGVAEGKNKSVMGSVEAAGEIYCGKSRKKIFEVILNDGSGYLHARWFHYPRHYFNSIFKKGERFIFFGEVTRYRNDKQMFHPDAQPLQEMLGPGDLEKLLNITPVYNSTEGLQQKQVRKHLLAVLAQLPQHPIEFLSQEILDRYKFPTWMESISRIHHPQREDDEVAFNAHRSSFHRRMVFCELFYLQLGLGLRRRRTRRLSGFAHQALYKFRQELIEKLPFILTEGQNRAIGEISRDMCSATPMNRLLQGDVGSGKTLVSLVAGLLALENGRRAALMAPTEILAEQHFKNFRRLLEGMNINVLLLTSSVQGEERAEVLKQLQGKASIFLIGTHALIEEEVLVPELSLVIIDEQHRFGVRQRMSLMNKAEHPHILVMTATPIPRSLAMTLYGDLDLSLMTEMPKGRQPILTRVMRERDRPKMQEFVRKKIAEGQQAYFVFPLIEESEKVDLKDAKKAFENLQKIFPEFTVGLLHGRMKGKEKEAVMSGFASGKIQILVATTVIEVGIDVPNATLMVIEHAERFGLSQLHQLRGRVGRGGEKSYCILSSDYKSTELARERLKVMENHRDGFKIAEEDLKIRGPGDFLGTRQSGMPDFRVANLVTDLDLLELAREAAQEILGEDPDLASEKNRELRKIMEYRWKGRLGLGQVG